MTSKALCLARRLPPLPTIGDILRIYGIRAKKNLSQNFIMDPKILKKFAGIAGNLHGKYVIEVGPGPGGITRAVLEAGAEQIHVIEKDPRFLPSLQLLKEAAGSDKLHICIGDCLYYNPKDIFSNSLTEKWESPELPNVILMGNLPFNVATPLLIRLLDAMHSKSNIYTYGRVPAILTFQHEVALRMAAPPGDPERCRLSIVTQNWAEVDYVYNLPGGAFVPPPEVQVGIVKLTPLVEPYITGLSFPFINKVITGIFTGKQKKLKHSIANALFPKALQKNLALKLLDLAAIPHDQRAINLTMDEIGNICYAYKHMCDEDKHISNGGSYSENYVSDTLKNIPIADKSKEALTNLNLPSTDSSINSAMQFDIRL